MYLGHTGRLGASQDQWGMVHHLLTVVYFIYLMSLKVLHPYEAWDKNILLLFKYEIKYLYNKNIKKLRSLP